MSRFEVTIRRLDEAEVVEDEDDDAPVVFHYFPGKGRKKTSHAFDAVTCWKYFSRVVRPAFQDEGEAE